MEHTILNAAQLAEARKICVEFGGYFDGILDRIDQVEWALEQTRRGWPCNLEADCAELLTSVNPKLAQRILAAGRAS